MENWLLDARRTPRDREDQNIDELYWELREFRNLREACCDCQTCDMDDTYWLRERGGVVT